MQKRWGAGCIRQESVTGRGGGGEVSRFLGLSESTVGEWVTITSEMRFRGFKCLLDIVLGSSNCSGSSG